MSNSEVLFLRTKVTMLFYPYVIGAIRPQPPEALVKRFYDFLSITEYPPPFSLVDIAYFRDEADDLISSLERFRKNGNQNHSRDRLKLVIV